jgi:hypothetical protein
MTSPAFAPVDLSGPRRDVLNSITDFFGICLKAADRFNSTRYDINAIHLELAAYIRRNLTVQNGGRTEIAVSPDEWQAWSRYKNLLHDYQRHCSSRTKAFFIDEYERLKEVLRQGDAEALEESTFENLARAVAFATAPQPPPSVAQAYWYSIIPYVFTKTQADRAITKIGALHQEYLWIASKRHLTKDLRLFVWRTLKQFWLADVKNRAHIPDATIHSEAFERLKDELGPQFYVVMDVVESTHEILHWREINSVINDFSVRCRSNLNNSEQRALLRAGRLSETNKELLHAFVTSKTELNEAIISALEAAAAQYDVQCDAELDAVLGSATSISGDDASLPSSPPGIRRFSAPTCSARYMGQEYVRLPMPETRALELASSNLIDRDMSQPGIVSTGLRVRDLVNTPKWHVLPAKHISPWKRYLARAGPFSLCARLMKLLTRRKRSAHVRPRPRVPLRVTGRGLSSRFRQARQTRVKSVLSPVTSPKERATKSRSTMKMPNIKLRGGGPKSQSPSTAITSSVGDHLDHLDHAASEVKPGQSLADTPVLSIENDDHAPPGVQDTVIQNLEKDPEKRPSLSHSPLLAKDGKESQAEKECHPCPKYPGHYHHVCGQECFKYQEQQNVKPVAEYDLIPLEVDDLDTFDKIRDAMIEDLKRVFDFDEDGNFLCNSPATIHLLLRRFSQYANDLYAKYGIRPDRDFGAKLKWENFRIPSITIAESGQLVIDGDEEAHSVLTVLLQQLPEDSADPDEFQRYFKMYWEIVVYKAFYVNNFNPYVDNETKQPTFIAPLEKWQSFQSFADVARSLQYNLEIVIDVFDEVDGFSSDLALRKSHQEIHDSFRRAWCDHLAVRRGLADVIRGDESLPTWEQYRYMGQGLNPVMAMQIRYAIEDVQEILAFFESRDADRYLYPDHLSYVLQQVRTILYSEEDEDSEDNSRDEDENEDEDGGDENDNNDNSNGNDDDGGDGSGNNDKSTGDNERNAVTDLSSKRSPKPGSELGSPFKATSGPSHQPTDKKTPSPRPSPSPSASSTKSKKSQPDKVPDKRKSESSSARSSSDDSDEDVILPESKKQRKTPPREKATPDLSPRQTRAQHAGSKKPATPPKQPNRNRNRQIPTRADYERMTVEDIRDEIRYRQPDADLTTKMNKPGWIDRLMQLDAEGNYGMGCLMCRKSLTLLNYVVSTRAGAVKEVTREMVRNDYGDILVPEDKDLPRGS